MSVSVNRLSCLLAATALLLPMAGLNVRAETLVAEAPPEVTSTGRTDAAKPAPDEVELAALYYYASEHQEARVKAEAERLRLKFPGFEMPRDLGAAKGTVIDEAPLWALYEKNDFAAIDAKIASLKADNPGWEPSPDFLGKQERRKIRIGLTGAFGKKDWTGVIAVAERLDLRHETEVDLLWMLIDAYRAADMKDAAAEVYKGILSRPAEERLPDAALVTTLQKASADFSPEEVRAAMASLWPNPSSISGLKQVNDDFIRRDIADFNRRSERQEPVTEKDVQRLRDLVAARADVADMSLLGWYFLKLKQPNEAEPYFSRALTAKPSPEFAKGLYLSLAQQKRDDEAYAVAAAHLNEMNEDPEFLMNALSLRFAKPELGVIDPKSVEAYSSTILKTKSANHAEILAWYAYNSQQFQAAEAWFSQSWNWEEEPNRLKGLALSYLREGKKKQFKALRAQFGDLYPEMWAEITSARPPLAQGQQVAMIMPPQDQPAVVQQQTPVAYAAEPADPAPARKADRPKAGYLSAFKAKRFFDCLQELDRMGGVGAIPADAELIRGWCHLSLYHISDARASFAAALAGQGAVRTDAAYGGALAALRVNLTDEAEAIVSAYPLPAAKDHEVRAEIYWQRARSAFDHKDYEGTLVALNARLELVAEPADLTALRAWAHAKLNHKSEAKAIFAKLNGQFSDPKYMRGITAMNELSR